MKKRFLIIIIFVALLFSKSLYSQTFTTTPYITMPGDNSDIDVLYNYPTDNIVSFICWVNHADSVYTLYLRQTSPDSGKNIALISDTAQIANPKIAFVRNSSYNSVRIVWQSFINNHWQLKSRICNVDTLTDVVGITDSLDDNITPALSGTFVAWIRNGNLVYRFLDSVNAKLYILDSANCSNPDISKSLSNNSDIVYEKGTMGNKQIMEAFYNPGQGWIYNKISNGGNNIKPRMNSMSNNASYEKYSDGVWKAVYDIWGYDTTNNVSFNCENPISYSYAIINKLSDVGTVYFVVYDSDSLKGNKEIIIKTAGDSDTTMNLSNAKGDDYLPNISFFVSQDTSYKAIYWIHDENGKKDIWMAYAKNDLLIIYVKDPDIKVNNFILKQNYPNPFNPSTVISWNLAKGSLVTLKVYDILGNEVATLVNQFQYAGEHSITFDTQHINHRLSSGIYFYQLKAGSNLLTKKMMYLK